MPALWAKAFAFDSDTTSPFRKLGGLFGRASVAEKIRAYTSGPSILTRESMSDMSLGACHRRDSFADTIPAMKRVIVVVCTSLSFCACAQMKQNAKEVARASAEYQEAKGEFNDYLAGEAAKAEQGWADGNAAFDAYMAAPGPQPATSSQEAKAWYDQRWGEIQKTDQHYAAVQYHDDFERGYLTHMKLGEMERRLLDELHSFEANLSAEDGHAMHMLVVEPLLIDAIRHYDAWDQHYKEMDDDNGTLAQKLSTQIEQATKYRDELRTAYARSTKIIKEEITTKSSE